MQIDGSVEKWREEVEHFIAHWEHETESIKQRMLHPDECTKISDLFHKDSDGLLVKRPVVIADNEVFSRLERLDDKLNAALAMSCTTSKKI